MREVAAMEARVDALERELAQARRKQRESEALLQVARAIPLARTFSESARAIFDACKEATGASAGYVALLSDTGEENEVLFLDAGGRPCTVDPSLPMPIRGLRALSYQTNAAVFDNDFAHSEWMGFMPEGHVLLANVMFSPVVIGGKAVGLIGLANKEGGFTDADAAVATSFGELAAVALRFARYQDQLHRWAHLFEHAEWGVAVVDPATNHLDMLNPAFAAMHGYGTQALTSKPLAVLWAPSSVETLSAQLKVMNRLDHLGFECEHRRKDGSLFPVLVDVTAVREPADGDEAMSSQEPGRRYLVLNVQDITERKAAEEALRRSNVALTEYAGAAAHELQEPLRLISSYSQLLARRYRGRLDADADAFIDQASGAAERLQRLLNALLVYAGIGSADSRLGTVSCASLFDEVLGGLGLLPPTGEASGVSIEWDPLPEVCANRGELELLFRHLLANALESAGGGAARIRVRVRPEREGWWRFTLADQGVGIDPRHHERIFGLFSRLQGPTEGAGMGIGLALCRKVVEHCGGRLWVESQQGQGAAFHFTLPAARPDPAKERGDGDE